MNTFYSKEIGFLNARHRYKGLAVLSLLPFILKTLLIVVIVLALGVDSFIWSITIPIWVSLLVSGIGFSSDNKKWNVAAWISTLMLTIGSFFIGYYDYIRWTTTKFCFGLLIFFTIIFIVKRYLDKKSATVKQVE